MFYVHLFINHIYFSAFNFFLKFFYLVDIPSGMEPEKFARLRSALSECENPSTPVRPSLSPITEHPARAKRTESAYYTHAERAYSLSTRARKLTLTR